ncbi:hypothetical protein T492DRAFT_496075 [Pavlovales sp. CCMP2436]|nr:hypothetical protein T492DRAFT_496075 [Pavlovales sp. CCMP2436]
MRTMLKRHTGARMTSSTSSRAKRIWQWFRRSSAPSRTARVLAKSRRSSAASRRRRRRRTKSKSRRSRWSATQISPTSATARSHVAGLSTRSSRRPSSSRLARFIPLQISGSTPARRCRFRSTCTCLATTLILTGSASGGSRTSSVRWTGCRRRARSRPRRLAPRSSAQPR